VSCSGGDIHITASLEAVLRRLRLPDKKRALWADSICIDQENRKEQGNQVALMGDIYRAATKTIIYLGPDPIGHGANVASLVADIGQLIAEQLEGHVIYDSIPKLDPNDPLAKDHRWQSVTALYRCTWFTRVWVIQEAALGRDAFILWGATEIPWAGLLEVQHWLLSKAKQVWFENKLFLNDLHRPGYWIASTQVPNFVEVLARGKPLGCTDERDRVYAFLGSPKAQIGEGNTMVMRPDYEKDFREVYLEFGIEWLKKTNDLCLLSAVEHTADTFKEDLPSWVPRWEYPLANDQFGLYNQGFDASKGCVKAAPEFTSNSGLKVRGLIFDTVHFRSGILAKPISLSEPKTNVLHGLWKYLSGTTSNPLCSIWKHLSQPTTKFAYNDVPHLLAFARTICRQEYPEEASKFHPDEAAFSLGLCRQSSCFTGVDVTALERDAQGGDIKAFLAPAEVWAAERRVVITEKGYYGLAPQIVQEGDVCCVVYGMCVPTILRRTAGENCYKFVGEAFVLGITNGEVIEQMGKWGLKEEDVILC
jgi:RNAse (barnase) inhibitor barstar